MVKQPEKEVVTKEHKVYGLVKEYESDGLKVLVVAEEIDKSNSPNIKFLEWMRHYWRPLMAALYFVMCFLEYVVRPIVNTKFAEKIDLQAVIGHLKGLEGAVQLQILEIASRTEIWAPTLTPEVHYTFLVILGVAAWTRGQEKTEMVKRLPASSNRVVKTPTKEDLENAG